VRRRSSRLHRLPARSRQCRCSTNDLRYATTAPAYLWRWGSYSSCAVVADSPPDSGTHTTDVLSANRHPSEIETREISSPQFAAVSRWLAKPTRGAWDPATVRQTAAHADAAGRVGRRLHRRANRSGPRERAANSRAQPAAVPWFGGMPRQGNEALSAAKEPTRVAGRDSRRDNRLRGGADLSCVSRAAGVSSLSA